MRTHLNYDCARTVRECRARMQINWFCEFICTLCHITGAHLSGRSRMCMCASPDRHQVRKRRTLDLSVYIICDAHSASSNARMDEWAILREERVLVCARGYWSVEVWNNDITIIEWTKIIYCDVLLKCIHKKKTKSNLLSSHVVTFARAPAPYHNWQRARPRVHSRQTIERLIETKCTERAPFCVFVRPWKTIKPRGTNIILECVCVCALKSI